MSFDPDDPKLVYIPEAEATTPPAGIIFHHANRWWCVHPQRGLIFFRPNTMSAQCNTNPEITKSLRDKLYPWAEVKFIPSVFRPINPQDYV